MAELPPYRTPRWVKFVGITALVLALLVAVVLLTGIGGEHGPNRHVPSSGATATLPATGGENSGIGGPAAADETVTFTVTNTNGVDHRFTVGAAAGRSGGPD